MSGYVYDQAWQHERDRLAGMEALWDRGSQRIVEDLGIGAGAHVLEIGGGGGALAEWLADRVGPSGRVVATDIDTRFLEAIERPNVDVRRHDIVTDELPEGPFNLIHARLVLEHLPARGDVLDRLAGALAPEGVLLIEDYDWSSFGDHPATVAMPRISDALMAFMDERGYDRLYGRRLIGELRARGLRDVDAEGRQRLIPPTSRGAEFFRLSLEALGPMLVERGDLGPADLEEGRALFADPQRLIITPTMVAAWGRRQP